MAGASCQLGSGRRPCAREEVQGRAVAALALLGADTNAEAVEVLRKIPDLRDALAERLAAVVSWAAVLVSRRTWCYTNDLPGRDRGMVRSIGAGRDPGITRSLRTEMSDQQAARALRFLARAADRIEEASRLFKEFGLGTCAA